MVSHDVKLAIIIFFCVFLVLCPCMVFVGFKILEREEENNKKESVSKNDTGESDDSPINVSNKSSDDDGDDEGDDEESTQKLAIQVHNSHDSVEVSNSKQMAIQVHHSHDSIEVSNSNEMEIKVHHSHESIELEGKDSKDSTLSAGLAAPTVDVHKCSSNLCRICLNNKGTQFIAATPLAPSTVNRIRALPNNWWEKGESFDLSAIVANSAKKTVDDADDKSIWSRFSRRIRGTPRGTPRSRGQVDGDQV